MQHHNNKIDAALLGKIVLARFLELPTVTRPRWSPPLALPPCAPGVSTGRLEGARVAHDAADIPQTRASAIL
ncbi:MAG: hypothetical protein ACYCY1_16395 [Sulfuriferula sp.]